MNSTKLSIFLGLFFLVKASAFAQSAGKISGTITTANKRAAEAATISLLRAKDSAILKLSTAGKEGAYSFEKIPAGKYIIAATSVGHGKAFSKLFELSAENVEIKIPAIMLNPVDKNLAGVTLTTRRPLVEQRIDRTIVNVDASVTNAGTSALELLEKSPGISVDRDGNISLKGKEGVLVMIDGRPTQLGGADLANLLRNMNSSQLDQVEIMTNPPARYDAAGTSGIINLKTKKTITAGFNGSASAAYAQGRYPKANEAFNFNFREGKINLFANLGHNYQKGFGTMFINRNIFNSNASSIDKIFIQQANRISEGNSYTAKFGVDFFATKKSTFGAVANLQSRQMSSVNANTTNILNASKDLESITSAGVNNETKWNSFSTNLNFRSLLNKKGKEITADIDLAKHSMDNDLLMINAYRNAAGTAYRKADTLTGLLPQDIKLYSGRIDYVHPLTKTTKFEAGIKSSIVNTDNNARYDSIEDGRIVHDVNRSNHFVYEENINAAYANLSTPLSKKITAQFGLRMENTNAKGTQRTTGEKFNRHYTQLFPTAYFQYKANEKNIFSANFGRRVRRTGYQSLNPFIRFIDRYTFSRGNPNLRPSVGNNFEVAHSWKNQLTTTLNYSRTKDNIDDIIDQQGQEAYNMPSNISSLTQFGISVNANTPVTKWWTSTTNINAFNNRYKAVVKDAALNFEATSFIINSTQQFKISKTLTAELNGRYRNGWLEGIMKAKSVGFIGAGLSQQVWNNKGTVRLTARDIFHTQKFRGRTQYGNVDFGIKQIQETQIVTIGLSYRFSKGKKIGPVKRTAGSANEEQERIGQ